MNLLSTTYVVVINIFKGGEKDISAPSNFSLNNLQNHLQ